MADAVQLQTQIKNYETSRTKALDAYYAYSSKVNAGKGTESELKRYKAEVERYDTKIKDATAELQKIQKTSSATSASTDSTSSTSTGLPFIDNVVSTTTAQVEKITGIIGKLSETIDSTNSNSEETYNKVASAAEKAQQLIAEAPDKLASVTSSVKNSLEAVQSKAKALWSKKDSTEKQSLASSKSDKGPQETDSKVKSIESNSAEAVAQPVSFVTKSVKTVVESSKSAPTDTKKEELPTKGPFKQAAEKFKAATGQEQTVTSTIKNVTSELKGNISSAFSTVKSTSSVVVESATSTIDDVNTVIKSSISGAMSFVDPVTDATTDTVSDIVTCGKGLTHTITGFLPDKMATKLNALSDSYIDNKVTDLVGDKLKSLTNICDTLTGVKDSDSLIDVFNKVDSLAGSTVKAKIANSLGAPLTKQFGDNSSDLVQSLYSAAKTVCPNISIPSTVNLSLDKDLLDILLALAGELGISDLIEQLTNCSKTSSLSDARSTKILQQAASTSAVKGDVNTFAAIVNSIGATNIANSSKELTILNANMSDTDDNVSEYNKLVSAMSVSTKSLLTPDSSAASLSSTTSIYDATKVSFMSVSNTKVVDEVVGTDNRSLIEALYSKYH